MGSPTPRPGGVPFDLEPKGVAATAFGQFHVLYNALLIGTLAFASRLGSARGLLLRQEPSARYALRVHVTAYAGPVVSTWVLLAIVLPKSRGTAAVRTTERAVGRGRGRGRGRGKN